MANQGTISGSTNYSAGGNTICLNARANWTQEQDVVNNRSIVTVEFQAQQTRGVYMSLGCGWSVSIGGGDPETFSGQLTASQGGDWTTCWTKSYTISHETDGTKTTSIQITGSAYEGSFNILAHVPGSGAQTITLDPIVQPTPTPEPEPEPPAPPTPPEAIVIQTHPSDVWCTAADVIQFEVVATGVSSYQWQISSDAGVNWSNVSGEDYTGITTSELSFAASSSLLEKHYRCKMTSAGGDVAYSKAVRFRMAATIASVTPDQVQINGTNAVTVTISKPSGTSYCTVEITLGGYTSGQLAMDGDVTSKSFVIPKEWSAAVGNNASATCYIYLRSYKYAGRQEIFGTQRALVMAYALCGIASAPDTVDLPSSSGTTTPVPITVSRVGSARYMYVMITLGNATAGPFDADMTATNTITAYIPYSFGSQFITAKSKTGTISLITTASAEHDAGWGTVQRTFVCNAPSSLGPSAGTQLMWLEGGGIDANGALYINSTRLRTGWIKYNTGSSGLGARFKMPNSMQMEISSYNASKTFQNYSGWLSPSNGWMPSQQSTRTISGDKWYRFALKIDDNTAITPASVYGYSGNYPRVTFELSGGWCISGWAAAYPIAPGANDTTVNGWGQAVAGASKIAVVVDTADVRFQGGASFASAWAVVAGKTYQLTRVGSTTRHTALSDLLTAPGATTVSVTVQDTRGYQLTASYTPTIYAYSNPTITGVDVFRCDQYGVKDEQQGEYISVKATSGCSPVGGYNSITALRVRYQTGGGAWSAYTNLTSGTASVIGGGNIETTKSYTVQIEATDAAGRTTTFTQVVSSASVLVHAPNGGRRLAIGRYFDSTLGDGWVDLGMSLRIGGRLTFEQAADIPYWTLESDGTELEAGTDLNDILTVGNYFQGYDAIAAAFTHKPTSLSHAFGMKVYKSCGFNNWLIQEIIDVYEGTMWRRKIVLNADGTLNSAGTWYKFAGTAD